MTRIADIIQKPKLYLRNNPVRSFTFLFGHLFFILLALMSLYSYKERMLPFDSSYFVFKIIHFNDFNVEVDRYGIIPSQLLAMLALKMGWSLPTLLKLYSLNFVLLQYVLFLIVFFICKNNYAAIALIFSICIGYRYSFYYSVSEIHQAIAPSVVLYALIISDLPRKGIKGNLMFSLLLLIVCGYLLAIHKLSVLLIFFIAGYGMLHARYLFRNPWFLGTMLLFFGFSYRFISNVPPDGYEASRMVKGENIIRVLTDIGSIPAWNFFKVEYHKNYYLLTFVGLTAFLFLLGSGKYLKSAFLFIFTTGLFVLLIAYDVNGNSPYNYQNYYCIWGLVFSIPFCCDFLPRFKFPLFTLSVALISLISLQRIFTCRILYEYRTAYMERIMKNTKSLPEKKFITHSHNVPWSIVWATWATPFETLLLSSLPSPDSSRTFCVLDTEQLNDSTLNRNETFYGAYFLPNQFPSSSLNQNYFHLAHTPYRLLNTAQNDILIDRYNRDSISLRFPEPTMTICDFDVQFLEIDVINKGKDTLRSWMGKTQNPLYISYHLFDSQGKLMQFEKARTRLEMDVFPGRTARIAFELEVLKPGEYIIEADIISEFKRWWEIKERCRLIVK